jgi:hypothetical protein
VSQTTASSSGVHTRHMLQAGSFDTLSVVSGEEDADGDVAVAYLHLPGFPSPDPVQLSAADPAHSELLAQAMECIRAMEYAPPPPRGPDTTTAEPAREQRVAIARQHMRGDVMPPITHDGDEVEEKLGVVTVPASPPVSTTTSPEKALQQRATGMRDDTRDESNNCSCGSEVQTAADAANRENDSDLATDDSAGDAQNRESDSDLATDDSAGDAQKAANNSATASGSSAMQSAQRLSTTTTARRGDHPTSAMVANESAVRSSSEPMMPAHGADGGIASDRLSSQPGRVHRPDWAWELGVVAGMQTPSVVSNHRYGVAEGKMAHQAEGKLAGKLMCRCGCLIASFLEWLMQV